MWTQFFFLLYWSGCSCDMFTFLLEPSALILLNLHLILFYVFEFNTWFFKLKNESYTSAYKDSVMWLSVFQSGLVLSDLDDVWIPLFRGSAEAPFLSTHFGLRLFEAQVTMISWGSDKIATENIKHKLILLNDIYYIFEGSSHNSLRFGSFRYNMSM